MLYSQEFVYFRNEVRDKFGPRSVKISFGTDNLNMIIRSASATAYDVVVLRGSASGYLDAR